MAESRMTAGSSVLPLGSLKASESKYQLAKKPAASKASKIFTSERALVLLNAR